MNYHITISSIDKISTSDSCANELVEYLKSNPLFANLFTDLLVETENDINDIGKTIIRFTINETITNMSLLISLECAINYFRFNINTKTNNIIRSSEYTNLFYYPDNHTWKMNITFHDESGIDRDKSLIVINEILNIYDQKPLEQQGDNYTTVIDTRPSSYISIINDSILINIYNILQSCKGINVTIDPLDNIQ